MIQPLLARRTSTAELAERYKDFIVGMVLNGVVPRRK